MNIEWIPSQFYDDKKRANKMIIIHHTGSTNGRINSLQGTVNWFKPDPPRTDKKVSAQYIIGRKKGELIQMVKDEHRAYHAGKSQWTINGRLRKWLNNWSIGIELQGDGNLFDYSEFQYKALIWLCKEKMRQFDIPIELIQGHEHISPGRKVDPGLLFDWKLFRSELQGKPVVQVAVDVEKSISEQENVVLPEGANHSFWSVIMDFLYSIFKFVF
ncbi:N-acetylmuramoyl-L-alanine amidase [Calditrichota bacterium]